MIMKYFLLGSTKTSKKEALASHEKIVEGWKDAIRAAEQAQEYWPLHVTGRLNNFLQLARYVDDGQEGLK